MASKTKTGLFGIRWDQKSSFLKGAAKAPPLIRQALQSTSANLWSELGYCIDEEIMQDLGDATPKTYGAILPAVTHQLKATQQLITLGGDHSITYPVLKAYSEHHPRIDILHIDAHGDLYDEFDGDRFSHACPFARIMEEGLARRLVQVGIRTLNDHQRRQADRFSVEVMEMKNLDISKLPQLSGPVYVSLDLDGLDPACAPGVSHHEPGGLTTREVIQILHSVKAPMIGADIVEYNPDRDINGVTAMVAAKLLKEIAGCMVRNQTLSL